MRSRLARLGVVFAGLVGLLGTVTPAEATTIKTVAFVVEATLGGGLSYPCVSGGPTINLAKCPTTVTTTTLPLPQTGLPLDLIPNAHVTVAGGNTRGYSFGTQANLCAVTGVNILKGDKPPVHPDVTCDIRGSGVVTGSCGLSSSNGTAELVILGQPVTIFFHFTGVGGNLVITGHARKNGQWGKFYGVALAVPIPTITGTTIDNSCLQKTADTFTVVGGGTIVIITHELP